MDKVHTCCVTGHRNIPEGQFIFVWQELERAVQSAILNGYTHFISGFAAGVDLMFAEIVAERKSTYPITLEAAIPYLGRMKTADHTFQRLIRGCDVIKIHSEKYIKGCYMVRNRYMVDQPSLVIAVYDGRSGGGTAATVRYANTTNTIVKTIHI